MRAPSLSGERMNSRGRLLGGQAGVAGMLPAYGIPASPEIPSSLPLCGAGIAGIAEGAGVGIAAARIAGVERLRVDVEDLLGVAEILNLAAGPIRPIRRSSWIVVQA